MKLLVDAHALLWAVDNPAKLGTTARTALQDPANELLLSAGTLWEIAIKVGLGKLTLSQPFLPWMTQAIRDLMLILLPVSLLHADSQIKLPSHHGDPFDRMLIAQAVVEGCTIVSSDSQLDSYGVARLW